MTEPPIDDRSQTARAFDLATQLTTIALMMGLPALPGYWLDNWLGVLPLFTLLGLTIGLSVGFIQLIRLVRKLDQPDSERGENSNSKLDD